MQKTPLTPPPLRARKTRSTALRSDRGFGLIEVLVAMALIAGAYITVVEAYQLVLLRYGKIEAQRTQLNRAQDEHERGAP